MPVGSFSLVLHSHLPYYRKAGMWPFGEENLYEAIAETYLPLLNAIDDLRQEGIPSKLTIGITPVLAEQLADEHLMQGYEQYIADILERIEKDRYRYSPEGDRERAEWEAAERRNKKLEEARKAWAIRLSAAQAVEEVAPVQLTPPAKKGKAKKEPVPQVTAAGPGKTAKGKAKAASKKAPAKPEREPTLDDIPPEPIVLPDQPDPRRELVEYYHQWYSDRLHDFQVRYRRDILGAFKFLQDEGCIEIITSAATHGFSPLLSRDSSLSGQFQVGVQTYRKYFGRDPKGVWLPECAYRPAIDTDEQYRAPVDKFLHENGLQYFFTDSHAVEGGKTKGYRRIIGPYGEIDYVPMPERPLTGLTTYQGYWLPEHPVAVYARNERAGYQVWAAEGGYPGDGWYREFHKKDGNSGMPYWRITGPKWDLAHKDFYNPQMAMQRVHEHSDHYVALIHDLLKGHQDANNGEEGYVVVPFDTELYGHWWFEGIEWIKQVIRKMAQGSGIRRVTVGEHMAEFPPEYAHELPESTWGAGGHYHVWMNPDVEYMWPIIHRCEERMEELVDRYPDTRDPLLKRALNQAARELLVLEGSDWPFLVTTGQAKTYAMERFTDHVARFENLADGLLLGTVTEELVAEIEDIDNLFADIDYRVFRERQAERPASREPVTMGQSETVVLPPQA